MIKKAHTLQIYQTYIYVLRYKFENNNKSVHSKCYSGKIMISYLFLIN